MASWFGTIAGNVESLLDRVDQVANQTFIKDDDGLPTYFDEEGNVLPPESQMPRGSLTNAVKSSHQAITVDLSRATPRADGETQNSWAVRQKLVSLLLLLAIDFHACFHHSQTAGLPKCQPVNILSSCSLDHAVL
jgi:hypothetical protein